MICWQDKFLIRLNLSTKTQKLNASSIQDPRHLMQIATGHVNLNNGVLRIKSEAGRVRNHEEWCHGLKDNSEGQQNTNNISKLILLHWYVEDPSKGWTLWVRFWEFKPRIFLVVLARWAPTSYKWSYNPTWWLVFGPTLRRFLLIATWRCWLFAGLLDTPS